MAASWPESPAGRVNRMCSVRRTFASSSLMLAPLFERAAEPMRGVDAEDSQRIRPRDEFQLLERKLERAVLWMALHIGVELRRREVAVDHVAFQLGHVDAVGGEAAQRLIERGRYVADAKRKSRDAETLVERRGPGR